MTDALQHHKVVAPGHFIQEQRESGVFEHTIWPYRLLLVVLNPIAFVVYLKKKAAAFLGLTIRYNFALLDGLSAQGRTIRDNAGSWRAMEAVYDFVPRGEGNTYGRIVDFLAMNLRQAQAARNRLRLVTQVLLLEVAGQRVRHKSVRILSLAAGSGRGVIEVMRQAKTRGIRVEALLVDLDPYALAYAQMLARRAGVNEQLSVCFGDVWDFPRLVGTYHAHIVEMIGLCEYLDDDETRQLFRMVREHLSPDGCFITSQNAGGEGFFLRNVANWHMRFRQAEHLKDLLTETGFNEVSTATEPQHIQHVFRGGG
jgi:SAM-dependent methyltransferase